MVSNLMDHFDAGKDVLVAVITYMSEEKAVGFKEGKINPQFEDFNF